MEENDAKTITMTDPQSKLLWAIHGGKTLKTSLALLNAVLSALLDYKLVQIPDGRTRLTALKYLKEVTVTEAGLAWLFQDWRAKAARYAENHDVLAGMGDIFAEGDPYDLAAASRSAFDAKQSPEEFVDEMFEEDIARSLHNEEQFNESLMETE